MRTTLWILLSILLFFLLPTQYALAPQYTEYRVVTTTTLSPVKEQPKKSKVKSKKKRATPPPPIVYPTYISEREILEYAQSLRFFDPTLIVAIARVESGYRHRVMSLYKGIPYYGLMQMSYGTAHWMGFRGKPHDLLSWRVNIRYAAIYLTQLREEHQTLCRIVAAYNAGTVYMRGNKFVNQHYVEKVLAAHRSLQKVEMAGK